MSITPQVIRIASGVTFLGSILIFPWWISLSIGLTLLIGYSYFFEIIIGGFLVDMLFGVPIDTILGWPFPVTTLALLLYLLRLSIRRKLFIHLPIV